MSRKKMYPVDLDKLTELLKKRGLTTKQASNEIGYADDYLKKNVSRGTGINEVVKNALERLYDIKYEEYALVEKETKNKETNDYQNLSKVVYTAVYKAVADAIKDSRKESIYE